MLPEEEANIDSENQEFQEGNEGNTESDFKVVSPGDNDYVEGNTEIGDLNDPPPVINSEEHQEGESNEVEDDGEEEVVEEHLEEHEEEEMEVSAEDFDELSQQAFGFTTEEIEAKLERLEELEAQPKLSDEKQIIFDTLSNYQGSDFHDGLDRYARLSRLDLEGADDMSIMREAYIQKTPELKPSEAAKLFDHDYKNRYSALTKEPDEFGEDGEDQGAIAMAELSRKREANLARQELTEAKKSLETAPADTHSSEDQAAAEAREVQYTESVDNTLDNFNTITISDEENSGMPDFNFEVENIEEVKGMMMDMESLYGRYSLGEGQFDHELMKNEFSILANIESYTQASISHGVQIERQRWIAETGNQSVNDRSSNSGHDIESPTTFGEAISSGNLKIVNGN